MSTNHVDEYGSREAKTDVGGAGREENRARVRPPRRRDLTQDRIRVMSVVPL